MMMKGSGGPHWECIFVFTPLFETLIDFGYFKFKSQWSQWPFTNPMKNRIFIHVHVKLNLISFPSS